MKPWMWWAAAVVLAALAGWLIWVAADNPDRLGEPNELVILV